MIRSGLSRCARAPSFDVRRHACRATSRRRGLVAASPGPILAHHLHKHALTQATVGHAQPRTWKRAADRLEDRATREYEVRPFDTNARTCHPFVVAHGEQAFEHGIDVFRAHPAAVD